MTFDFTKELPTATVKVGRAVDMRIYGFADIRPPLVEIRSEALRRPLHLTVDQAEQIAVGLISAAKRARQ